jgi:hypothetical protein
MDEDIMTQVKMNEPSGQIHTAKSSFARGKNRGGINGKSSAQEKDVAKAADER